MIPFAAVLAAALNSGLPPESAAELLPPRAVCEAAASAAQELRSWYDMRSKFDPVRSQQYFDAAREADLLYAWWNAARDLRCGFKSVGDGWVWHQVGRREAMGRMRDLIGQGAWDRCEWPPPVPYWRFERVD